MSNGSHIDLAINAEFVARILGAVGQVMRDFQNRDLAMQDAVADLTCEIKSGAINVIDLQHIDLVTQTHADLAKFLPRLAKCLRDGNIDHETLASTLTLHSLQEVLLVPTDKCNHVIPPQDTEPGEMQLL